MMDVNDMVAEYFGYHCDESNAFTGMIIDFINLTTMFALRITVLNFNLNFCIYSNLPQLPSWKLTDTSINVLLPCLT